MLAFLSFVNYSEYHKWSWIFHLQASIVLVAWVKIYHVGSYSWTRWFLVLASEPIEKDVWTSTWILHDSNLRGKEYWKKKVVLWSYLCFYVVKSSENYFLIEKRKVLNWYVLITSGVILLRRFWSRVATQLSWAFSTYIKGDWWFDRVVWRSAWRDILGRWPCHSNLSCGYQRNWWRGNFFLLSLIN